MVDDSTGAKIRKEMEAKRMAFRQRLAEEADDLKLKVQRLEAFINSGEHGTVSDHEKGLLSSQLGLMKNYLQIVQERSKL